MTTEFRDWDTQDDLGEPPPRVEFTDPKGSGTGWLWLAGMSVLWGVVFFVAFSRGW